MKANDQNYVHAMELVAGMRLEGKPWKDVYAECEARGWKVSHVQAEFAALHAELKAGRHGGYFPVQASDTAWAAVIAKARTEGQSWGMIAARANMPEGRVRRIFKGSTALDSRGLRIGKGGRFVDRDPRFYVGARAKGGTELDPNKAIQEQVPDPEAPPVYTLPQRAEALVGGGTPKVKAQRKPRTPKAKA